MAKARTFDDLPKKQRKRLAKAVTLRRQVDLEIKDKTKGIDKLRKLRTVIEARVGRYVNREDKGVHSLALDGYESYAQKVPVYSLKPDVGRMKLDKWVCQPLTDAKIPHELIQEVMLRLAVFKNDPVKSVVEQYRLDTGGKLVPVNKDTSELVGGDLPGGIRMSYRTGVGFRQAKS